MQQPHQDDEAGDGHAEPPGPLPADARAGQPVLDIEGDGRERREHVQPVADLADRRVADLEPAQPHQDQPRNQDHQRRRPAAPGRTGSPPCSAASRGRQVREAEDQKRHDQQEPQQQVKSDHEHIEERLLRRAQVPGERGHAREIEAVGAKQAKPIRMIQRNGASAPRRRACKPVLTVAHRTA